MKLERKDFLGDPFEVAKNTILGSILVTKIGGKTTAGMITEIEIYIGGEDKAAHTYGFKKTRRVLSQYEAGGHTYVFLIYGIHAQFCVVLGEENVPNVVLVRSIEPIEGIETMLERRGLDKCAPKLCAGPGNAAKALGITTALNGVDLCECAEIYLLRHAHDDEIVESKRVGIAYAEEYAEKKWRYYYKNSPYVTHKDK